MTTQILFIVWRESVEALLVIGILNAWITHNAAYSAGRRYLWGGVLAGLAVAIVLAYGLLEASAVMSGESLEYFQAALVLIAAGLIVQMVFWMRKHGRQLKRELQQGVESAAESGRWWTVTILAAIAVAREGSETVVFLYGMFAAGPAVSTWTVVGASAAGFALALLTYGVLQLGGRVLSWRLFFSVTEAMLLLLACALFTTGIGDLASLGLIPYMDPVWDTSFILDDMSRFGGIVASLTGYRAMPDPATVTVWVVFWGGVALLFARAKRVNKAGEAAPATAATQ
ncbi:high-affinity iron transporter [Breoghania corrubedonensis]|uniref:High-affinity iron transporter n=1 Tax=Breoghania corrubedonensis TaxID=665038 RepID=A0A2T5VAZ6_9HYPH|nr:FTR1 family protein [Breoghania corrubedonensis]PTW60919.1 high-affinity iron transporter [Breoghania corrubedonensis]